MIRKAGLKDVRPIYRLIRHWAQKDYLLGRSLSDICDNLRDFFVSERDGEVLGCGALHITWLDLAEIRSVAVAEEHLRRGVGGALVETCIGEARALEVPRLFTLTYMPEFFERFGFKRMPKEAFPHKIWTVCINCPHYPDCDEVVMALDLDAGAGTDHRGQEPQLE